MADVTVAEPFPVFTAGGRYFIYDINTITYARRVHNICGVLIGTIPHISQQNVFSGVPLELMPEEARILAERGHAYIVDDVKAHGAMLQLSPEERNAFRKVLEKQGKEASQSSQKTADKKKEEWLRRKADKKPVAESSASKDSGAEAHAATPDEDPDTLLFASATAAPSPAPKPQPSSGSSEKFFVTPATSHPPLPTPPKSSPQPLPVVNDAYPLFAYLYSKGYFMSPGLRFGCQFCVYPGDPLRFHSHYLATGKRWDEEFQLLDVVGGGRLGTAVKKAYVLGGAKPAVQVENQNEPVPTAEDGSNVRAFSIEWAGM